MAEPAIFSNAADFQAEFAALGLDGAWICPHGAESGCDCRRPKPGMLLDAARRHSLDLTRCAVIGDLGGTDMLAAADVTTPAYVAENLLDAVRWLLSRREL